MSLLFSKLRGRLEALSEGCDFVMGASLKDLTTGEQIHVNADEIFPVASTIKVPILMEFYRRVEEKSLDPTKPYTYKEEMTTPGSGVLKALTPGSVTMPLIDWADLMISVSDNTATNLIIDLVGLDSVNAILRGLRLKETTLARKMMDMEAYLKGKESLCTPRELVALFEALYRREAVSPYVCDETLAMLRRPKEGIIEGVIRSAVPSTVEVADKSGWIGGATLDTGIVYVPDRPYALSLHAKHIPATDIHHVEALHTLTVAAKLIYAYFEEVAAATPQGRKKPI